MTRLIISILLLLAALTGCSRTDEPLPVAEKGILDLRGIDICRETIELKSYWEYYPSALLSPDDLKKNITSGGTIYTIIPRRWNPGWTLYIPGSGRGFATYRLMIKTGPALTCGTAIRIPQILSSYILYINGKPVHSSGRPGTSIDTAVPGYDDAIVPLPHNEQQYELVLQVANFHSPAGGIVSPLLLGNLTSLIQSRERENLKSVFLLSSLLLLFLYQVFMFAAQRDEPEFLYFGIFCFCAMLYSIGLYDTYWSRIIPFPSWSSRYMIMAISVYMGLAFIHAYLQRLLPLDVPLKLVRIVFITNVMLSITMLLLPSGYYAFMLPVLHIDIICCTLIPAVIIVRSAAKKRREVLYVCIGLGIVIFSLLFDILAASRILPFEDETVPWAVLIMIIIQVSGMTKEFNEMKSLSVHLKADNENLRNAIKERMRGEQGALTDSVEEKINSAVAYLEKNFTEDISRENLAAALDIHPDNFSRYFRQHTGKKYSEYINDLRIREAIRLLKETEDSVITIAMNVGFNSLRTFNHAFLSITGRTPGDFRKAE